MVNLLNVFLCIWSTPGDVCCDLLSVRQNRAAQESSFQSFCKAARSNGAVGLCSPFAVSGRISFGSFTSSHSEQERFSAWPGDHQAVEVSYRGHHVP